MTIEIKDREIVFLVDGQEYSRSEIKKMIEILTDLSQICDFEWPYRGPDLQSRAITLVGKSKK